MTQRKNRATRRPAASVIYPTATHIYYSPLPADSGLAG